MKDLFVRILGAPEGIVLFQLIVATQFTIYLSLIAFFGGGGRCGRHHHFTCFAHQSRAFCGAELHLVLSINAAAYAFISVWAWCPAVN